VLLLSVCQSLLQHLRERERERERERRESAREREREREREGEAEGEGEGEGEMRSCSSLCGSTVLLCFCCLVAWCLVVSFVLLENMLGCLHACLFVPWNFVTL